jgi:hypothetical protein
MIRLLFGIKQQFRYRHSDINLIGNAHGGGPVIRSEYSLNGAPPVHFYVEPEAPGGGGNSLGTRTGALIRLSHEPGSFNIEIPVTTPSLREGVNQIDIQVQHADEEPEVLRAEFAWDSHPVSLPLSLIDLSSYASVQEIGQVVDGNFEIDPTRNVIRTVEPVGADVLLLLGSPAGSQEATYDVSFSAMEGVFIGLSDFFVGHEPLTPELGIKPGYSSAGLATLRPSRWAEAWLMRGALLDAVDDSYWTLSSPLPVRAPVRSGVTYCVRHQVIFGEGVNLTRFRIWPKSEREPQHWRCVEHDADLADHLPRFTRGSFGLFQYGGRPTEWSNIHLRSLEVDHRTLAALRMKRTLARRTLRRVRRKMRIEQRVATTAARLKARVSLAVGLDLLLPTTLDRYPF